MWGMCHIVFWVRVMFVLRVMPNCFCAFFAHTRNHRKGPSPTRVHPGMEWKRDYNVCEVWPLLDNDWWLNAPRLCQDIPGYSTGTPPSTTIPRPFLSKPSLTPRVHMLSGLSYFKPWCFWTSKCVLWHIVVVSCHCGSCDCEWNLAWWEM